MKRLGAAEKGLLVLGGLFMVLGLYMEFYPINMIVIHLGSGRYDYSSGHGTLEHVTIAKSRIYGVLLIALAMGISWLVFYRPKK
jgi:hypothetical protein